MSLLQQIERLLVGLINLFIFIKKLQITNVSKRKVKHGIIEWQELSWLNIARQDNSGANRRLIHTQTYAAEKFPQTIIRGQTSLNGVLVYCLRL